MTLLVSLSRCSSDSQSLADSSACSSRRPAATPALSSGPPSSAKGALLPFLPFVPFFPPPEPPELDGPCHGIREGGSA
eukprot:7344690-Prymnesium_polylepis.1